MSRESPNVHQAENPGETLDDAEKIIMARLRGAGSRDNPELIARQLAELPATDAAAGSGDVVERFRERLINSGASVATASDRREAVLEISRFVSARHAQRRVTTGHDARLAALPWRDGGLLPRFGSAADGDAVAVSWAMDGIAETGSVVLWLDRRNPALNNLLPDDQIILVERERIQARLEDLWHHDELHTGHGPRGVMMISGPSSTADIGLHLVKGAHGPRALHVIIVGETEGE